jgi:hypothetical protein
MAFLDGYRLEVPRSYAAKWNGQVVDDGTLKRYLREFAALQPGAGSIFVEFEPRIAADRRKAVEQMVIDSGLCRQKRCAEIGWKLPRPVVN